MKKYAIIGIVILFLATIVGVVYYSQSQQEIVQPQPSPPAQTHGPCLEDEYAHNDYHTPDDSNDVEYIVIGKQETREEVARIQLPEDWTKDSTLEILTCGFYIVRDIDALEESYSLWRYAYDGIAEELFTLSGSDEDGKSYERFSSRFNVNDAETYIVLYSGGEGLINITFRNLQTGEDEFSITNSDLDFNYGINMAFITPGHSGWEDDIFYISGQGIDGIVYGADINIRTMEIMYLNDEGKRVTEKLF